MTEQEFISEAENYIYKEVAKNTNLMLGKNKTAALSTGLFLKLPIVVKVSKSYEPLPKLTKPLKEFLNYFGAYVELEKSTQVTFTFLYHTEKDFKALLKNFKFHNTFFAFVYLHEVQHILRKHNTNSYHTMMTNLCGDAANPHHLINVAEDHAINYSLKDLIIVSPLKGDWTEIEEAGMYSTHYHKEKMSDIEILKDLINTNPPITTQQISDLLEKVMSGDNESLQPIPGSTSESPSDASGDSKGKGKADKCSTDIDDADASLSDLAESLKDIITSNTKGTQAGDLFEDLFASIKVETGWFKKIKASFKRQVFYKTHDYTTSWSNLNNTYRKIYKSPKRNFVDTKINIILSVDHSGSMSTEDLQKLLYLIESEAKKISSIKVLIHDTRVIKEFMIEDDYDISNSPEFKQALATRYTSGGTSHECVFKAIEESKLQDPNMVIYMSFSDNYSDIESCFKDYPVMRKLTNYWICAGANNPVKVPGTNIAMS